MYGEPVIEAVRFMQIRVTFTSGAILSEMSFVKDGSRGVSLRIEAYLL